MLDMLLKYAPEIMSLEKEKILTPYLDMISKIKNEANPATAAVTSERCLSLQMGSKITSAKWRISVLQRLLLFLRCNKQSKQIGILYAGLQSKWKFNQRDC